METLELDGSQGWMAEDTVRRAMVELATKLDTMAQELRKKPEERLVGVEPAVALEKAHLAAQAMSQQARAAFFLDVLACTVEDATACLADLETKCVIYHSWAKPLLACISPTARKVAAGPLAQVLLLMQALLGKAASPGEAMRPADLGQLDAAVDELPQLPVRGTDAARGVLLRSEALVEDALQVTPNPHPHPNPSSCRTLTLTPILTLTLALILTLTCCRRWARA